MALINRPLEPEQIPQPEPGAEPRVVGWSESGHPIYEAIPLADAEAVEPQLVAPKGATEAEIQQVRVYNEGVRKRLAERGIIVPNYDVD